MASFRVLASSAEVRERICRGLTFLAIEIDDTRNAGSADVSVHGEDMPEIREW